MCVVRTQGSRDPGHAPTTPFEKILRSYGRTVPGINVHVKFEVCTLTVLELLAILTPIKNLMGHVTLATPPFGKISREHVRTVSGNIRVKFEVRSFNRFGAISI